MSIRANKGRSDEWTALFLYRCARGHRRITAFLASLEGPAPKVTERVVASGQCVVMKPLRKSQGAVVSQSFDDCLNPVPRIVGRSPGGAVKVDIKLDL